MSDQETYYKLVPCSGNRKTGPMPVVMCSSETCPASCPFMNRGCYVRTWPLIKHQNDLDWGAGYSWDELMKRIRCILPGTYWRYGVSGDLPGDEMLINDHFISMDAVRDLCAANRGRHGFGYTHKPVHYILNTSFANTIARCNREAVQYAVDNGFALNVSAEGLHKAAILRQLGVAPVVTVMHSDWGRADWRSARTPLGDRVLRCPAEYNKSVKCTNCGGRRGPMCAWMDRDFIIGFTTHGSVKAADSVVTEMERKYEAYLVGT